MKPVIGITSNGRYEVTFKTSHYESFYFIPSLYVDAVRRAGGIALLIPPDTAHEPEILRRIDGLIITGGADVNPALYGGNTKHPSLTIHDQERDTTELAFIREAVSLDMPLLCVCRGVQALNVALGGTLHEHVLDVREQDLHRNEEGGWTQHDVQIESDSLLAKICQTDSVHTFSGHHQAINQIAPDLKVIATAPDGIIEALTHPQHRWLLGVQWHPEKSAEYDPTQQRIFDALVQAVSVQQPTY